MSITDSRRIIRSGFINFWRNGSVSVAAILVFIFGKLIIPENVGLLMRKLCFPSMLSLCIGKIACIIAGCCYGVPCNSVICIRLQFNQLDTNRVPIQFLELLMYGCLAFAVKHLEKKQLPNTRIIGLCLVGWGATRLLAEFYRAELALDLGFMPAPQFIALLTSITGLLIFNKQNLVKS